MSFFSFFRDSLKDKSSPPPNTELSDIVQSLLSKEETSTDKSSIFDFEDRYWNTLEKFSDSVCNTLPEAYFTADQQVAAYKKAIEKYDKIKEFCESKGGGGALYYQENFVIDKENLINEYNDFMNEEYKKMKEQEQEDVEYIRYCKTIEKQILKLIASDGSYLQKKIYSLFSADDKSLVIRTIDTLVKEGKLSKQKQGNTNLLKIIK